ncbi:MAG TPA: response regulator transcription factor [Bacillus sp. (in: firmicutes)]|nr:response regulator transcription factor [Bacillus sp. (in: firmicutes)]
MSKIMLVDDEVRMLELLELYLIPYGFQCIKFESGEQAVQYVRNGNRADLMLLDLMMPEKDGWEVCREIREFSKLPIIMLTARNQAVDIVNGLNIGADDYVTKPFNEEELIARIQAVLRRVKEEKPEVSYRGLTWNGEYRILSYSDKTISLTRKEFELIGLFLKNPGRVFTREDLLTMVWGFDTDIEDRTIDSHMRNLRDKLRKEGFPVENHLQTVWGVGYKWVDE